MNLTSTSKIINSNILIENSRLYKTHKPNRNTRTLRKNMIKQKLCGLYMVFSGVMCVVIEHDWTALVLFSFFFLPMIFGKHHIMTFKE